MRNQKHWDADTKLDNDTKLQLKLLFETNGFHCTIPQIVGDDCGIDIIINNKINIDVKIRRNSVYKYNDVLIELYKNWEANRKPGWALDHTRLTHEYLYVFTDKLIMFNHELISSIGEAQKMNIIKPGEYVCNHNRFSCCCQGDFTTISYAHPLNKIYEYRTRIKDLFNK